MRTSSLSVANCRHADPTRVARLLLTGGRPFRWQANRLGSRGRFSDLAQILGAKSASLPTARALPLKSGELGTSRWQLDRQATPIIGRDKSAWACAPA